jgi:hypothetical protein
MNITCTTLFKVRREEGVLLKVNVAVSALSAVLAVVGALVVRNAPFIVGSVVLCLVMRSIWSERHFDGELGVSAGSMTVVELGVTLAFLVLALNAPTLVGFWVYVAVYLAYVWVYRARLRELAGSVRRAMRG